MCPRYSIAFAVAIVIRSTIWYCLFEVWSGLLFLACANGFLSLPHLLTLLGAAVLAIYDLRFMEYPLFIWCCLHTLVLFLSGGNLLMLVFLLLAIGAHFFFIGMGAGDFLLLATFSLSFSSTKILILIQIASILGILVFALKKKETGFPLFPVSFSVITLYCFIRCFADKFFLFCMPSASKIIGDGSHIFIPTSGNVDDNDLVFTQLWSTFDRFCNRV